MIREQNLFIKNENWKQEVADFHLHNANMLCCLERYEESLNYYQEIEKYKPLDFRTLWNMSVVLDKLGKPEEAELKRQKSERIRKQGLADAIMMVCFAGVFFITILISFIPFPLSAALGYFLGFIFCTIGNFILKED